MYNTSQYQNNFLQEGGSLDKIGVNGIKNNFTTKIYKGFDFNVEDIVYYNNNSGAELKILGWSTNLRKEVEIIIEKTPNQSPFVRVFHRYNFNKWKEVLCAGRISFKNEPSESMRKEMVDNVCKGNLIEKGSKFILNPKVGDEVFHSSNPSNILTILDVNSKFILVEGGHKYTKYKWGKKLCAEHIKFAATDKEAEQMAFIKNCPKGKNTMENKFDDGMKQIMNKNTRPKSIFIKTVKLLFSCEYIDKYAMKNTIKLIKRAISDDLITHILNSPTAKVLIGEEKGSAEQIESLVHTINKLHNINYTDKVASDIIEEQTTGGSTATVNSPDSDGATDSNLGLGATIKDSVTDGQAATLASGLVWTILVCSILKASIKLGYYLWQTHIAVVDASRKLGAVRRDREIELQDIQLGAMYNRLDFWIQNRSKAASNENEGLSRYSNTFEQFGYEGKMYQCINNWTIFKSLRDEGYILNENQLIPCKGYGGQCNGKCVLPDPEDLILNSKRWKYIILGKNKVINGGGFHGNCSRYLHPDDECLTDVFGKELFLGPCNNIAGFTNIKKTKILKRKTKFIDDEWQRVFGLLDIDINSRDNYMKDYEFISRTFPELLEKLDINRCPSRGKGMGCLHGKEDKNIIDTPVLDVGIELCLRQGYLTYVDCSGNEYMEKELSDYQNDVGKLIIRDTKNTRTTILASFYINIIKLSRLNKSLRSELEAPVLTGGAAQLNTFKGLGGIFQHVKKLLKMTSRHDAYEKDFTKSYNNLISKIRKELKNENLDNEYKFVIYLNLYGFSLGDICVFNTSETITRTLLSQFSENLNKLLKEHDFGERNESIANRFGTKSLNDFCTDRKIFSKPSGEEAGPHKADDVIQLAEAAAAAAPVPQPDPVLQSICNPILNNIQQFDCLINIVANLFYNQFTTITKSCISGTGDTLDWTKCSEIYTNCPSWKVFNYALKDEFNSKKALRGKVVKKYINKFRDSISSNHSIFFDFGDGSDWEKNENVATDIISYLDTTLESPTKPGVGTAKIWKTFYCIISGFTLVSRQFSINLLKELLFTWVEKTTPKSATAAAKISLVKMFGENEFSLGSVGDTTAVTANHWSENKNLIKNTIIELRKDSLLKYYLGEDGGFQNSIPLDDDQSLGYIGALYTSILENSTKGTAAEGGDEQPASKVNTGDTEGDAEQEGEAASMVTQGADSHLQSIASYCNLILQPYEFHDMSSLYKNFTRVTDEIITERGGMRNSITNSSNNLFPSGQKLPELVNKLLSGIDGSGWYTDEIEMSRDTANIFKGTDAITDKMNNMDITHGCMKDKFYLVRTNKGYLRSIKIELKELKERKILLNKINTIYTIGNLSGETVSGQIISEIGRQLDKIDNKVSERNTVLFTETDKDKLNACDKDLIKIAINANINNLEFLPPKTNRFYEPKIYWPPHQRVLFKEIIGKISAPTIESNSYRVLITDDKIAGKTPEEKHIFRGILKRYSAIDSESSWINKEIISNNAFNDAEYADSKQIDYNIRETYLAKYKKHMPWFLNVRENYSTCPASHPKFCKGVGRSGNTLLGLRRNWSNSPARNKCITLEDFDKQGCEKNADDWEEMVAGSVKDPYVKDGNYDDYEEKIKGSTLPYIPTIDMTPPSPAGHLQPMAIRNRNIQKRFYDSNIDPYPFEMGLNKTMIRREDPVSASGLASQGLQLQKNGKIRDCLMGNDKYTIDKAVERGWNRNNYLDEYRKGLLGDGVTPSDSCVVTWDSTGDSSLRANMFYNMGFGDSITHDIASRMRVNITSHRLITVGRDYGSFKNNDELPYPWTKSENGGTYERKYYVSDKEKTQRVYQKPKVGYDGDNLFSVNLNMNDEISYRPVNRIWFKEALLEFSPGMNDYEITEVGYVDISAVLDKFLELSIIKHSETGVNEKLRKYVKEIVKDSMTSGENEKNKTKNHIKYFKATNKERLKRSVLFLIGSTVEISKGLVSIISDKKPLSFLSRLKSYYIQVPMNIKKKTTATRAEVGIPPLTYGNPMLVQDSPATPAEVGIPPLTYRNPMLVQDSPAAAAEWRRQAPRRAAVRPLWRDDDADHEVYWREMRDRMFDVEGEKRALRRDNAALDLRAKGIRLGGGVPQSKPKIKNSYNFIIDPVTNKKHTTKSLKGRSIIQKFIHNN